MHTRHAVAALALMLCAAPALAQQSPNTTPGGVTRVILIRVKPGHTDAFWADVRQHQKPVVDEEKRLGIVTGYSVGTKSTLENPDDWGVVFTLTYPNWATLDQLQAKVEAITLAHYGSAANRTAAQNARNEHSTVVASFLVREQTINPWK